MTVMCALHAGEPMRKRLVVVCDPGARCEHASRNGGLQGKENVLHLRIDAQEFLHRGILERGDEVLDVVGVLPLGADGELSGELVGGRGGA